MYFLPKTIFLSVCFLANVAVAQKSFSISLPDVQIYADRLVRGDGDTYGLGDWQCAFTVALDGPIIQVDGKITFREEANDFTTIVSEYHQRTVIGELERCRHCQVSLEGTHGTVSGENIGARGYRWFQGKGLIRRAKIQTDTFGNDVGKIGGTVQFAPVRIMVDCSIASK